MKYTDDYRAKVKVWAANPQVVPMPKMVGVPRIGSRKFNSYAEMNAWKRERIREIARQGGVR
jgi:hypothetical protein